MLSPLLVLSFMSVTWISLGNAQERPKIPSFFESRAEVNLFHLNLSIGVEEWQDPQGPFYRLRNKRRVLYHDYIFDYKNGEMHHFIGDSCITHSLTSTSHAHIFGMSVLNYKEDHPISAVGALKAHSKFNITETYSAVIRGIDCQCYKGTAEFEEVSGEITGEYCWSTSNWDEMGERNPEPISIILKGEVESAQEGESKLQLHTEIHFHEFLAGREDMFQTPENLYCRGRKFSPVPRLPNYLSYHQESFADQPTVQYIKNGRVMYDKELKLMRFEYREQSPLPPFYARGSMSVIHDFNTGVAYYQDMILGNCTAQPIGLDVFDIKKQVVKNITGIPLVELRSPNELLQLNGNFSFVGEKILRGIPTHYYIGLQKFAFPWLDTSDETMDATIGIHFLHPDIETMTIGRGVDIHNNVPLQLVIEAYNDPAVGDRIFRYKETYNFFNFDMADTRDGVRDMNEAPAWAYDIQACYSNLDEKHIRVTLQGAKYYDISNAEKALLPTMVLERIRRTINGRFSAIRLQQPEVDYNETHIFLTVTMLPQPKPESQFIRVPSTVFNFPPAGSSDFARAETLQECQTACARSPTSTCQAYSYCPSIKTCQFSSKIVSMLETKTSKDCEIGTRTVVSNGAEVPIDRVVVQLRDTIARQDLQVRINNVSLTVVEFLEDVYRRGKEDEQGGREFPIVGRHLEQFTQLRNKQLLSTRVLVGTVLADECAQQCLNDGSEKVCIAFTYFYKTGKCSLSTWDPEIDKDKITINSEAVVFRRNFLAHFTALDGEMKHVLKQGVLVDGPNSCAKRCIEKSKDTKDAATCRSFDLCSTDKQDPQRYCFLSASHQNAKENEKLLTLSCTHYSRNFDIDFVERFEHTDVSLLGFRTEYGVSQSQCASQCVEKDGINCKGYFFCPSIGGKSACGTVSASMLEARHARGNFTCSYYERIFLPDGSPYSLASVRADVGVSSGLVTFLVILFFSLGGVIAVVVLHVVQRALNKRSSIEDIRLYFTSASNPGTLNA